MSGGQASVESTVLTQCTQPASLSHTILTLWLSVCVWGMNACGGVGTQGLTTPCAHLKSHPRARYLLTQSEGPTLREARRSASAELARHLSAEVRAEVAVRGVARNGETSEEITERIEVSTHFKHGELIKPLPQCELCSGDLCITTVALNRDRAAQRLVREINPDVQMLYKATRDLKRSVPLLRFTQAWYQAQAAYHRIKPTLNQLRVLGRMSHELSSADQLMKRASQEVAQRSKRLWVAIAPLQLVNRTSPPQGLPEVVDGQFSKALESLKLKRWGQAECPTAPTPDQGGPVEVLRLSPQGELKCTLGLIGPQCLLSLGVSVELCPQQQLTQSEWSDLKLVGVHPRDPNRALIKLNQSVNRASLSAVLKHTLSPFIIF